MLLLCVSAPAGAEEPSADWWLSASAEIAHSEYRIRATPASRHAVNRAQDLRAAFEHDGIQWERRTAPDPPWSVRLRLREVRVGGRAVSIGAVQSLAEGTQVTYRRGRLSERWENTPAGFSLQLVLTGAEPGDPVEVTYGVLTDLVAYGAESTATAGFYFEGKPVVTLRSAGAETETGLHLDAESLQLAWPAGGGATLLLAGGGGEADPRGLSSLPSMFFEANQTSAMLGAAVAPAGDVNGDGFSDVIVGAPRFDAGQLDAGRALLFLGAPEGPSVIPGWTAEGDATAVRFGAAVAPAGDVNGDGFSDVIVGAPRFSDDQTEEGRALVYLGSPTGLLDAPHWTVDGNTSSARFGGSVSWAGDVNGDGFDDVIVGADFFTNDQPAEGGAWIYHGSAAGLSTTPSWAAEGDAAFGGFGTSVSAAGDVDGDGFDDVIVGAPALAFGQGRAFVYRGTATGAELVPVWTADGTEVAAAFGNAVAAAGDVNGDGYADVLVGAEFADQASVFHGSPLGPSLTSDWSVDGGLSDARFGASVATAGDVNGDGYADVLVGAPLFDGGDDDEGRAFLYLGSASGLEVTPAWTAEGDAQDVGLGESVFTAGDVNGDGFSDVVIGAPRFTNLQAEEGRAYLFAGSGSGPSLSAIWTFDSGQENALLGISVASAGDVNADGFSDVVVGANLYDAGENNEGAAFVFHGSAAGLAAVPDWTGEGNSPGAAFGRSVAAAGDVNGDGFGDLIVGAPGFTDPEDDEGRAFVFLGSVLGLGISPAWQVQGDESGALLGTSVTGAGDVDGDGYADVLVGVPESSGGGTIGGRALAYLGSPSGPSTEPDWVVESTIPGGRFGRAVASAGDVNRDGFSDVVVGAPDLVDGQALGGRAFVYLGSISGLSRSAVWTAAGDDFTCSLGGSVASGGDVDGDGFSDLLVGTICEERSATRGGRASLYRGSEAGLALSPVWSVEGDQTGSQFGAAVAGVGDANGDGFGDVVVGAPFYQGQAGVRAGRALLFLGSDSGPRATPTWIVDGDQPTTQLGVAVSGAGDVNGDGFRDVVVGANFFGASLEGRAALFYGNQKGGTDRRVRQLNADGIVPIGPQGRSDSDTEFVVEARGRSAGGRTSVRIELEVKRTDQELDGTSTLRSSVANTGPPTPTGSSVLLQRNVEELESGSFYRWRARLLAHSPLFPRTPWISLPSNAVSETKLRTSGSLPPPVLAPVGPGTNEVVRADSSPVLFSWNRGDGQEFRIDWSRNPEFFVAVESSEALASGGGGTIQAYLPNADLWRRTLRLAQSPEIREIPIFWRVVPLDGGEPSVTRTIRMEIPESPTITSPFDGAEFETTQLPTLVWDANHNERYQVRFSGVSHLASPRVIAGPEFEITTTAWTVPSDIWDQVVELASDSRNGVVHYAVFARDSLDRTTWSEVRTLRVLVERTGAFAERPGLRLPQSDTRTRRGRLGETPISP